MTYRAVSVRAENLELASEELGELVTQLMNAGWAPFGSLGLVVHEVDGQSGPKLFYFLTQAMILPTASADA